MIGGSGPSASGIADLDRLHSARPGFPDWDGILGTSATIG